MTEARNQQRRFSLCCPCSNSGLLVWASRIPKRSGQAIDLNCKSSHQLDDKNGTKWEALTFFQR
ncbi:hypothetical protein N7453_011815 [Penicillium expansum]|nr:hypothetical protein N7453_011815 [Penicillium expansum]